MSVHMQTISNNPQTKSFHFQKIYIMRNPKDVIVSQFFLTKSLMQVPPEYDLQAFIGDWLAEKSKFIHNAQILPPEFQPSFVNL